LLENLSANDSTDVFVKVYLDGEELPGGFERLKRAVTETLEEFKVYGGTNINYKFINPNAETDKKKREEFLCRIGKKRHESHSCG
jgi:ABC-2 type transport system permease protein